MSSSEVGRSPGAACTTSTWALTAAPISGVIVLIALATLIWVPVGVWIGLRPKLAERVQPLV